MRSQVVIDGWILLQVARRIDSPSGPGSTSGENGVASDVARVQPAVDYQLARRKGKLFSSDVSVACYDCLNFSSQSSWSRAFQLANIERFFFFILTAKEGAMDVLGQILEFDVARLLHHFERFVREL